MGLFSPKSQGSFGKQSCRSSIRGFGGIWLQAIPEFHWESFGSISVLFLFLAASNCCVKKGAVPPCLALPCIPAHTPAGRAEIHGASPRSGKEELKGLENLGGSAQELPALLHPPGIPQPRLAPPTRQLPSLGLGEFPWESSPRERSCSQGSLWRAGNGLRLSLFAGIQVWNTWSGSRGMNPDTTTVPPWLGADPAGNVTASHIPTLPSEQEDEAGAEASGISHPTGKGFRRLGHLLGAVVWSRRRGSGNAASLPW